MPGEPGKKRIRGQVEDRGASRVLERGEGRSVSFAQNGGV